MLRSWTIACVLLGLLQACGMVVLTPSGGTPAQVTSPKLPTPPASSTMTVTMTSQVSLTQIAITTSSPTSTTTAPTATPTPQPATPTPTLTACMRAGGRVEVNEFTTVLLPHPLVYRIYLPPCYDEQPTQSYPVLYLIHGQTYSDTQWDQLGVPEIADRLIASGETVPFIVVMPRDRVWLEPTEDNFGLAVVQSLLPWVDEHYRTIADRTHRAIGGLSRGGAWAIDIGLSHPELFSIVGLHSGFVFESEIQQVHLWLYNLPVGMSLRIYMDIASQDAPEITKSATWLEELLTRYDIPHEWHIYIGEHEEAYWQSHVEDYLRWYTKDW